VVRATLMSDVTTGAGLMAAAIAIGGFLAHIRPALAHADEQQLRAATVKGGVVGTVGASAVIVLSAING